MSAVLDSIFGPQRKRERPPFRENVIKHDHSFSIKPYSVKRPRTQGFSSSISSILPYRNTERNGYVRFNFHKDKNPANLVTLHHSYPLYTFPATDGTANFVDAPDGIYTWVLVYPRGSSDPVFAALQVHSKMELGSGHAETLERLLEVRPDLGFTEDSKTKMNVNYSGEIEKLGRNIKFNILSGSYMLEILGDYTNYNFGGRNSMEALNELFASRALLELQRIFTGQLEVAYNPGSETLITHQTVPLTSTELERYVSGGHANAFFVPRSAIAAGEKSLKPTNSRWTPFFETTAAASGAAAGSATATARRRKTRKHRRSLR